MALRYVRGAASPTADDPDFDVANLFTGTCIGTLDEVSGLFRRLDVLDGWNSVKACFRIRCRSLPYRRLRCSTSMATGMRV